MGAVPSQLVIGKDITGTSQSKMKAFVAVFAGIAAASAAPKADPWLVAHPAVYLGDAHTQTGDQGEYPNGAVAPDNTLSVKAATADHLLAKALQTPWWHPLGKREADPYYGVYGGYEVAPVAVAPKVEGHPTGFILSPGSGAVTPDFTAEQKEANPEIAEGSKSIDIPVVTGYTTHVVGKREADPLVVHWDGAVTPDYTPAQKVAAAAHFAAKGFVYGYPALHLIGKREAEAEPYYGLGYGYGGYGYGGYLYGKRSAEAEAKPYYGYGGYGLGLGYGYAAAPVIEPKDSGPIITPSSGAITPAFTDAQKEANPEIAEGSESIKVPVVTGVHLIGKREAKPYYGGYLGGYGGYGNSLYYGKRSAEAVAKPYYLGGYGYGGYYGKRSAEAEAKPYYGGYLGGYGGYGLGYYGKRSAEAEAKPYYGLYGYGYGGLCAYADK